MVYVVKESRYLLLNRQNDKKICWISVLNDLPPMIDDGLCHKTKQVKCHTVLTANSQFPWRNW